MFSQAWGKVLVHLKFIHYPRNWLAHGYLPTMAWHEASAGYPDPATVPSASSALGKELEGETTLTYIGHALKLLEAIGTRDPDGRIGFFKPLAGLEGTLLAAEHHARIANCWRCVER